MLIPTNDNFTEWVESICATDAQLTHVVNRRDTRKAYKPSPDYVIEALLEQVDRLTATNEALTVELKLAKDGFVLEEAVFEVRSCDADERLVDLDLEVKQWKQRAEDADTRVVEVLEAREPDWRKRAQQADARVVTLGLEVTTLKRELGKVIQRAVEGPPFVVSGITPLGMAKSFEQQAQQHRAYVHVAEARFALHKRTVVKSRARLDSIHRLETCLAKTQARFRKLQIQMAEEV